MSEGLRLVLVVRTLPLMLVRRLRGPALVLFALGTWACSRGSIGDEVPPMTRPVGSPGPTGRPSQSPSPSPTASPSPTPYVASVAGLRRLSRTELDATLRDVFGDETRPASRLLGEDEFAPYDNDLTTQEPSRALVDALDALGSAVAAEVLGDPAKRARLVTCTPSGPGDAACFRQVIEALGRRALRRPLTEAEVVEYLALQRFATQTSPHYTTGFDTAVELLIRALVLDPELLYRIEDARPTATAGILALDGYALASRLSYLLWGSAPDAALLADAEAGRLATPEGRRAAAERLLAAPEARAQLRRFHAMWLGYRTLPHPAALSRAFQRETEALIDRVVFDDKRDYLDLFRSDETWLDDTLADHYGLPRPAAGAGWVRYPAGSQRGGVLSHGSVLAAFSKFTDTSPTQRGILVRTRLLCLPLAPPPPTVMADAPPGEGTNACKKDRYVAHMGSGSCRGCHEQMDLIGFGLEGFDIAGRQRDHDDAKPECRIDGVGTLPGGGDFVGPKALAEKLIAGGQLDACVVRQWLTFALGRPVGLDEQGLVDAMVASFRGDGRAFDALMLDYVASDAFAKKKEAS